jgi:hypothetical protein
MMHLFHLHQSPFHLILHTYALSQSRCFLSSLHYSPQIHLCSLSRDVVAIVFNYVCRLFHLVAEFFNHVCRLFRVVAEFFCRLCKLFHLVAEFFSRLCRLFHLELDVVSKKFIVILRLLMCGIREFKIPFDAI